MDDENKPAISQDMWDLVNNKRVRKIRGEGIFYSTLAVIIQLQEILRKINLILPLL